MSVMSELHARRVAELQESAAYWSRREAQCADNAEFWREDAEFWADKPEEKNAAGVELSKDSKRLMRRSLMDGRWARVHYLNALSELHSLGATTDK